MNQNCFNDGVRLTEWRLRNFLSQEALAPYLGVTPQTISSWENGHTLPPPYLPLALELVENIVPQHMSAEAVRDWRDRHALTQVEMAEMLGVSAGTVYGWEKGRSRPPPLLPLALVTVGQKIAEQRQATFPSEMGDDLSL